MEDNTNYMEYGKFEKELKSKLHNATEHVDIDQLINAIHPIKKTDNKRKIFFLLLSAMFVYSLILGTNYFTKSNPISDTNIDHQQTVEPSILQSTQEEIKEVEDHFNTKNISNNNNNNNVSSNNNKSDHSLLVSESSNATTLNNSKATQKSILKNKNNLQSTNQSNINNSSKTKTQLLSTNSQLEETQTNHSQLYISLLEAHTTDLKSDETILSIYDPIKCPTFGSPPWILDIGAEIGLFKPIKQLENTGSAPSEIFQLRNEKEKSLEGIQASIFTHISKEKNPFYLNIGLSYTRITEQFKDKYSFTEMDTTQGIISITESQNGDTLTVIRGDIITTTTIEKEETVHHYFHLLDIPIGIGYKYHFKGYRFGVEVGAILNLSTKVTGSWLTDINTISPLTNNNSFNPNIGLSYYAGIQITKPISNRSAIYLSSRFRYNPNNFSTATNSIKQKYQFIGLHIGYLYSLEL